jgi:hypothetical protein
MSQLPTKYHDHLTFANQLSSLDIILMHRLPLKRLSTIMMEKMERIIKFRVRQINEKQHMDIIRFTP